MDRFQKRLREIAEEAAALRDELRGLAEADELSEEQESRFAELAADEGPLERLAAEKADIEKRMQVLKAADDLAHIEEGEDRTGRVHYMKRVETKDFDVARSTVQERRDVALKILETEARNTSLDDASATQVEKMVRRGKKVVGGEVVYDGDEIAKRLILTEKPAYRSAFVKGIQSSNPIFDADEARAVEELRAQSLTTTEGGFGVPVLIDPTIILTTGAADVPILRVSRVETITNNVWKGVSSAPASWSYDAEGAAVSDDAITLAQPVVTAYTARAFIPYSIEIGQDYPMFAEEMRRVIEQGYLDLIAQQSMTGSGAAPLGIFTAIDANASQEVLVTTSGQLSAEDVFTAWNALGERYRSRASWFSSVSVESEIRQSASNNAGLYSVDLTASGLRNVNGRPWYLSDYAPAFTGTTGTVNLLVVGDFSNYVIAQRAGMNLELVPHLFDVTNNRPTGQRGWFAWARHGMDSVNDAGFVLLKNSS